MPLFESYDRRIKQINEALAKYGIGSIEEAEQLCLSKGINVREIVNGIQPIAFENAGWAYVVGAAIANEGAIMQPYLVDGIYNANGERSFSPIPVKLKQAMDADTAAAEIDSMKGGVTEGTGGKAALDDVAVAGKTGTHERGDGSDDSWFVGIGPSENSRVVVAIVLEEGSDLPGGAASRAQGVLRTALQVQGVIK